MLLPGGKTAQIGIVHNYMPFEARRGKWHLIIWWNRALSALCNHCWGNDIILDYLGTGQLYWRPLGPFFKSLRYSCPDGSAPLDWVGLNYYSRCAPAFSYMTFDCDVCTATHLWQTSARAKFAGSLFLYGMHSDKFLCENIQRQRRGLCDSCRQ